MMLQMWKFSKGILLTAFATAAIWFLLLGFAYRQHRSSEILTGVIGGLTIILGMITAEWLRSSREQVELARVRYSELFSRFQWFLYNYDDFMKDQFSAEQSRHFEDFNRVFFTIALLGRTTRWPQPNAKKIREAARELGAKLGALQNDAHENGHIWSLEKRMALVLELVQISPLIWARGPKEVAEFKQRSDKYRESPKNEGPPFGWSKRASN
jgi:hypothetical protein